MFCGTESIVKALPANWKPPLPCKVREPGQGNKNTTSPLNIEGGRQFESSSEKEVDSFFPNMNAGQNCSQLLVRSRQSFPADRPTLLVVAGRPCLAGDNPIGFHWP